MDNKTTTITYNTVTVSHAVTVLNAAVKLDAQTITNLFNIIVPFKQQLAESDSVESMKIADDIFGVTVLGLINAIFAYSDSESQYRIFPVYDKNMIITEFRLGKLNE